MLVPNTDSWALLGKWQFGWCRTGPRNLHSDADDVQGGTKPGANFPPLSSSSQIGR